MAWTTPLAVAHDDIHTASDYNTYVKDNLIYLLSGRAYALSHYQGGSNFTSTSTSFVDADATNLKLTLTPNSGRVLVFAKFKASFTNVASNSGEFDWILDSTTRNGGTHGIASAGPNSSASEAAYKDITLLTIFTGLSVASHDFKIQYRITGGGGTVTIYNTQTATSPHTVTMFAMEI